MDRRDFLKRIASLPLMPLISKASGSQRLRDQDRHNIIILVFDTLSARHLSLHGYHRETTPNLAQFAERATLYHNHYSGGNFTVPGTASLLTGTYPWEHRAFNNGNRMKEVHARRNIFELLRHQYEVIAYPHNVWAYLLLNQMRESIDCNVHPAAFSLSHDMFYRRFISWDADIAHRAFDQLLFDKRSLPASLFFGPAHAVKGLSAEMDSLKEFADRYPRGTPTLNHYHAQFLVEDVVRGMTNRLTGARQPFLAYLHFYPPHAPYRPRREFVDIFSGGWKPVTKPEHVFTHGHSQQVLNQHRTWYDEFIAHVDAEFGRMCDSLDRSGLMDTSYVIFTSDHGELFERGVKGHSTPLLYEPLIRVPLLVSAPGQSHRRDVYVPTSCVDLLPTLLHLTGQPVPGWCEGQLLPELGGGRDADRVVFSVEAKENAMNRPLTKATVAMIRGTYKLIHYVGYRDYEEEYELYDLENDPEELEDLYSPTNPVATDMQGELRAKLQKVDSPYQ